MPSNQIGPILKNARKALKLTQKELARRARVSERLWAEVERGERPNVSLETALRMLSEVGASVRIDSPLGSVHELRDPGNLTAARAARAAIRRVTWTGRQLRFGDEESDAPPAAKGERALGAVAQVSALAYAIARAGRGERR